MFSLIFLFAYGKVQAQSDAFIGEIKMFAGNFAPAGWAFCDGQLLQIDQYTALYAILGTQYGGDGETTFALPDLRGRVPMHEGTGPGLTMHRLGEKGGSETVTLTTHQLPNHTHTGTVQIGVSDQPGNSSNPTNAKLANTGALDKEYTDQAATGSLGAVTATIGATGQGEAVNMMQPYTTINFIIAVVGYFPSN
ncbi:phage tail protein [Dyadobacter jejuensis]|nr:tail fiber protein [Dyadobacter jejuensis]